MKALALFAAGIDGGLSGCNTEWPSGHVQLELRSIALDREQNVFTATAIGGNVHQVS